MDSIEAMLDYRTLTAMYAEAETLVGTPFLDQFFSSPMESGDEVELFTIASSNSPAPGNTRGSMPRVQQAPKMSKLGGALFHSFNTMPVPQDKLSFLDVKNPDVARIGQRYIEAAFRSAGRRQALFREACLQSILNFGRINFDAGGNALRPTAHATTGALTDHANTQLSADFGLPSNHRGRCLISGSDYVFSGAWDTAETDIFDELELLRDRALKLKCERPTTVHLHSLQKHTLINNTKFQKWATLNQVSNEAVLSRNEFPDVWGWKFKFYDGYIESATGTQEPVIPLRQVIITPDEGPWKESYEGIQRVPKTAGEIMQSSVDSLDGLLSQAMNSTTRVQGRFAFGHLVVSPLVQLNLITGDNFGMGFPNVNGSWWAPTVFAA